MTLVPGDSAPGSRGGFVPGSSTVIVKSPALAVPPLSLITCLITISFGAMSLLVTVQVFVSPMAIVPLQSADFVAYPDGPGLRRRRCRRRRSTFVPGDSAPGKSPGSCPGLDGHREVADALAVPPLSLITCLITISFGAMSLLVTVQVFVSPMAIVPLQSAD